MKNEKWTLNYGENTGKQLFLIYYRLKKII